MVSKIYFSGGCFWCTEAIFRRVEGVEKVLPGYIGGHLKNPSYKEVCSGITGHAEAVSIEFNNKIISLKKLLLIFFQTHDPTQLNRQGKDIGTQYRSAIFYTNHRQKEFIEIIINKLSKSIFNKKKIVTKVELAKDFYIAEKEHLNYFNSNSNQPYCQLVISPKIEKLNEIL
jgi:peptide-methionine (S)-S-oxide reductase